MLLMSDTVLGLERGEGNRRTEKACPCVDHLSHRVKLSPCYSQTLETSNCVKTNHQFLRNQTFLLR